MKKISVVISAYNEEDNIENCLKSLKFADEIILVDNKSTDGTIRKAKKYTTKIFSQKNDPLAIDLLKNFGFEKASGDWILSIDADEEVSKELAEEITILLKDDIDSDGFLMPRKNIIFGKWIQYSGWYPDLQLRMFRKGKGRFLKKHVHEKLNLDGKSSKLAGHILHKNYSSVGQFIQKTLIYAPNEAEEIMRKGYVFTHFDIMKFPLSEFLSRFFTRKGYRDGFHGLALAFLMAFYHLLIFIFIWEKQGFKEYEKNDLLYQTKKEFESAGKETSFWLKKEMIESIKNPIAKNFQKITSKLR